MNTCLKTGLYFHVDNLVYHCDMFGDLEKQTILLKGFASETTEYTGGFHASWDKEKNALVPSDKFVQFMKDWYNDFVGWETWAWAIDDTYCRFTTATHTPKV
jgi:hypothetical protein